MTTKTVTVQAVSAAIRNTDNIMKSHIYKNSARSPRSIGAYTEKNAMNEIVLDYWTSGYDAQVALKSTTLEAVTATLQAKGFAVVERVQKSWLGERVYLQVVAA